VPDGPRIVRERNLDDRGLILTGMGLMTSMPGVFAAGDVRSGAKPVHLMHV
jgi:thioredoxin reductase